MGGLTSLEVLTLDGHKGCIHESIEYRSDLAAAPLSAAILSLSAQAQIPAAVVLYAPCTWAPTDERALQRTPVVTVEHGYDDGIRHPWRTLRP